MAPSLRKNAPILPNKAILDHTSTTFLCLLAIGVEAFHLNLLSKLTLTTTTWTAFDLKGCKLQFGNAHHFNSVLWQLEASHNKKGADWHEQASGMPVGVSLATAELKNEVRGVIKIQEDETDVN